MVAVVTRAVAGVLVEAAECGTVTIVAGAGLAMREGTLFNAVEVLKN